jgi:hypothetical protein
MRARHATGARVVGHQHQEAAGEGDEGGEGGALVATFFLLDLDDDFLALGEQVAHVVAPAVRVLAEVVLGDFLQRQEAVALRAVVDEAGLERGLDARDPSFVDVGFLLFLGRDFDGKVVQLLAINQRDAQLLLLSCIDEHSLHLNWTLMSFGPTRFLRRMSSWTAWRTTARRGGACREAKDCCGAREWSRYMPALCRAERQNPLGYFTDVAPDASFGSHSMRCVSSGPSSDGLVTEDQLICGAFDSSYGCARLRRGIARHSR